jgi:endonuclease YncB( thermonuclease family)
MVWGSQRGLRPGRRSSGGGLAALVLAAALLVSIAVFMQPSGRQVAGAVYVVDGDTLRMGALAVRLKDMDAPEMRQSCLREGAPYPCGKIAREALIGLVRDREVQCRIAGRDRYGRSLARCTVDGQDIGSRMIEAGYAVAYGGYEREEARARAGRLGLWAGTFEPPSQWRREHQS